MKTKLIFKKLLFYMTFNENKIKINFKSTFK